MNEWVKVFTEGPQFEPGSTHCFLFCFPNWAFSDSTKGTSNYSCVLFLHVISPSIACNEYNESYTWILNHYNQKWTHVPDLVEIEKRQIITNVSIRSFLSTMISTSQKIALTQARRPLLLANAQRASFPIDELSSPLLSLVRLYFHVHRQACETWDNPDCGDIVTTN